MNCFGPSHVSPPNHSRFWVVVLLFSSLQLFGQGVQIDPVSPICQGGSATLNATVSGISYGTESYTFEVLPTYSPEDWYPDATPVPSTDDQNHGPFEIGFEFCFFNVLYSQFYIGSNGWVGFTGGQSNAFVAQVIPSTNGQVPKNCIMAPWQDWHPGIGAGAKIFYKTIGTAPTRKLIVYWRNCAMWGCNTKLGNFQIVLCESGSEVYNHIESKPVCYNTYSQNYATQGVHNAAGTIAFTAIDHNTLIDRNRTSWYVDQTETPPTYPESTRFVPNGIVWHSGSATGPVVGYGPSVIVSPVVTTTYFAVANSCSGMSYDNSVVVEVLPHPTLTGTAAVCLGAVGTYTTEPGMTFYSWTVTGGVVAGGGSPTSDFVDVTWTNPAGIHRVTVDYTDPVSGCVGYNPTPYDVTIYPLPVVTLQPQADACIIAAPFPLSGGSPAGGFYSGTGVTGGLFDPTAAGVGTHSITYTWTDANSCVNSAVNNLRVVALPDVDFTGPVSPAMVCQDFPTPSRYQVTAEPATSYTWSIPAPFTGIMTPVPGYPNMVDVTWTGTGSARLQLDAVSLPGCVNSGTKEILIHTKPAVSLPACFDLVTTANAKPFLLKGGTPYGMTGSYAVDGIAVPGALLDPSTLSVSTHVVSYSYTDVNGCIASDSKTITVAPSNAAYPCVNSIFTDPRNPDVTTNKYPTFQVSINNRITCWMLKNLNWGNTLASGQHQTDNCTLERYCAPSDATCLNYGSLYQWDELMQYGNTPGWPKGVCPPGWHVPTATEWQDLIDASQGPGVAGGLLTDPYQAMGFHALLEGILYANSLWAYTSAGTVHGTMFWTSTLAGGNPVARGLNNLIPSVSRYESSKANAFPVRCVKD